MKIAFVTEICRGSGIKNVPRDHANMRTDLAWASSLKADIISVYDMYDWVEDLNSWSNPKMEIDLVIFIVPKKNAGMYLKCANEILPYCNKTAIMQEADQISWQRYNLTEQFSYLEFVLQLDLIFCHNENDRLYYQGLFINKKVEVLPSLMIEDAMPDKLTPTDKRNGVMIGGNWTEWYSGQDSYFISEEFGEDSYAPSMGRKHEDEDNIAAITYLPYMNWKTWIEELSKRKYAVHLMRTYAAGTFALNCARLGIPCIGWNYMDTQKICFPELSFNEGDMVSARQAAKHLKENKIFYNYCSAYAKKAYEDNFSEKVFLERFNSYF